MKESNHVDIHHIMEILPHRYPFLLIDRVVEYQLGDSLQAIKNVTVNEPFFQGHFPGRPVFPGVLILEAIAQASAILASKSLDEDPGDNVIFLFAGIDNARFKRPVEPGDQLVLDVRQTHYKRKIWKYSGQASVDGTLAASADIIFTYRNY
ncbi:MAG: 3-hydroxyacyl-ACP dehydratase FabZ [Arenicellales bacterium]|jgi:3-hydroxyacyl-[acyl-carrier-protein] dehydratase